MLTLCSSNFSAFDLYNHRLTGDCTEAEVRLGSGILPIYTNVVSEGQLLEDDAPVPTGRQRLFPACFAKSTERQRLVDCWL